MLSDISNPSSVNFLQVLGAGFGRTGTLSLRNALNYLGYKTHHMQDVILDPTQNPEIFEQAYKNPHLPIDWSEVYQGYTAAVDWPSTAFFDKLFALNPGAKIILTVRNPEDWFKSVSTTICEWPGVDETWPQNIVKTRKMARVIVRDGELGGGLTKAELIAKFVHWTDHIKAIVKPKNLLVLELGQVDAWEQLCRFLGMDKVPAVPYPHANKGPDFANMLLEIKALSEAAAYATDNLKIVDSDLVARSFLGQ